MQMSDDELRVAAAEELDWDPRIDSNAITVSATGGVVTLRGTVGSYAEKCDARQDVLRLRGVVSVEDELDVELYDEFRGRDDTELCNTVLQALRLNILVPSTVAARAHDGWVTLTGTATTQFQRAEAEHVTQRLRGVRGITNDITLVPFGPSTGDLAPAITKAMHRCARLDASRIEVTSASGTVTLRGTVSTWADHDDALTAAWNAPAVVHVVDDILVTWADPPPHLLAGHTDTEREECPDGLHG